MGFDVSAAAYDAFMGRWSEPLAARFAEVVGARPGDRVLDVGCGPGALTAVLASRLGPADVSAVDPSASFVAAVRERLPAVDVAVAAADDLPFPDAEFDVVTAQLVVHFLPDPVEGLAELVRVTRPGGRVAACVWDFAGGRAPLSLFWRAARDLDPAVTDESALPGARDGDLVALFAAAGLHGATQSELTVRRRFTGFDAWWRPMTLGVGPAGDHVAALSPARREALRSRCAELAPAGEFALEATVWTVVGTVVGQGFRPDRRAGAGRP